MTQQIGRKTVYTIHYRYPTCYDDGLPFHDEFYNDAAKVVEVKTDSEAQVASLADEFHRKEYCYHGRHSYTTKITKKVTETAEDGWVRVTESEVPRPTKKRCPCGQQYWPVLGEKPCHELRRKSDKQAPTSA